MTFILTEARKEWKTLFPGLSEEVIRKCVLAEKRELDGDYKAAEKNLNQAIEIAEVE